MAVAAEVVVEAAIAAAGAVIVAAGTSAAECRPLGLRQRKPLGRPRLELSTVHMAAL